MVVTITIYVNTTVIMTMTGTTKMIMIMAVIKTVITTMAKIFQQVQQDSFYYLLKMIKKAMKI